MATFAELNAILTDNVAGAQALREKVGVACLIASSVIIDGDDTVPPWDQTAGAHDKRIKWVKLLLGSYEATVRQMFGIVIASNAAATQGAILSASDASIQTAINESVDALASDLL